MPLLSREQRILIASGGFILFIGFTMLGLAILGAFNVIEIEILLQDYRLLIGVSITVGILDIIIGFLLVFPRLQYKGQSRVTRKKISRVRGLFLLGYLEVGVGLTLMVATVLFYFNVIDINTLITLPSDYFPLFIFVLFMLSFVFTVNGFYVIKDRPKM